MIISKRDAIATGLVAVAIVVYALWAADAALPGMSGVRASGIVVLALGFAASASAVVPNFHRLLHGSRIYLAVTSLIGIVAVVAGLAVVINASATGLGVLVAAMVVLWLIATMHHSRLTRSGRAVDAGDEHESASAGSGLHASR